MPPVCANNLDLAGPPPTASPAPQRPARRVGGSGPPNTGWLGPGYRSGTPDRCVTSAPHPASNRAAQASRWRAPAVRPSRCGRSCRISPEAGRAVLDTIEVGPEVPEESTIRRVLSQVDAGKLEAALQTSPRPTSEADLPRQLSRDKTCELPPSSSLSPRTFFNTFL